ncbi:hypothetical protein GCM10009854_48730 [Saccharopolyspora halophila]|uniref:Uncharacterized protein n=1 Tax=Saccharopolyspora halophila TaxID=405551 RepID=A0ABN3GWQ7_9PSEU
MHRAGVVQDADPLVLTDPQGGARLFGDLLSAGRLARFGSVRSVQQLVQRVVHRASQSSVVDEDHTTLDDNDNRFHLRVCSCVSRV